MNRHDLIVLRGWLVVLMTVYHVMSIAWQSQPSDFLALRFVSGAFIFITGLAWSGRPSARRGWRLLGLFAAINVAIELSGVGHPDKAAWVQAHAATAWERMLWVLWTGHPSAAAFGILLPIALMLIGTGTFSQYCQTHGRRSGLWLLVGGQLALLWSGALQASATVAWVSLGVWGLCLSLWPLPVLARREALRPQQLGWRMVTALLGGGLGLLLMAHGPSHPGVYAAATIVLVVCLYLLIGLPKPTGLWARWQAHLGRLGSYSLLFYLLQIILIHSLWRLGFDHHLPQVPEGLIFLAVVLFVQSLACEGWVRWRSCSPLADRVYRLVLG